MSFFTATSPVRSPSAIGNAIHSVVHGPAASHAYPFPAAATSNITGYNPYTAAPTATGTQKRCLSNTSMSMARVKSQTYEPASTGLHNSKSTRKVHDVPMRAGPSFGGAAATAMTAGPAFNLNPFEAVGMAPGGVTMEWGQDGGLRVVPQKARYIGEGKQSSIKQSKAVPPARLTETPIGPTTVSPSEIDPTTRNIGDRRAYGSVPPIPLQTAVPDARKGSLDASTKRRRPSFKIDIPAPPSAGALLKGFRHSITPMRERASEPMAPVPSHSGLKLLNSRRDSKDSFVILGIKEPGPTASEIHGQEMHEVAEEYKAAKGMGMGYSLNRRVSTPWTQKESADWLEMNREESAESLTEGSGMWALGNTMANARM